MLRESFPDLVVDVEDLIAEDDKVVSRLRMRATNAGDYRGGPATTRHAEWSAISIWRLSDGRLSESWGTADRFGMLQQLGVIPSDDEMVAPVSA
jgi:predicted ester cyclase